MRRLTVLRAAIAVPTLLIALGTPPDAGAQTYTPPASNRASMALNGPWRFLRADSPGSEVPSFDDSTWSTVTVPHTWNALDGQDGPDTGGSPYGRDYYRGPGRYRRHLHIPTAYAGRRLFLQFDGANLVTDVWVNGLHVGRHEGGYTAFRFDITTVVSTAAGNDNVITVKVDNSNAIGIAPLSGDFTFFGGIYRDVSLVVTDPLSAEMLDYGSPGVYLTQSNVTQVSADLAIKTLVHNAHPATKTFAIKTVVLDAAATIVATRITRATLAGNSGGAFLQQATIANPRLWNGRTDPYLYSVSVEIREGDETGPVRDLVPPQPLGFRSYFIDPKQGFFLNGRYLDLHGVNRHQDRLNKGWAISASDQDQDMRLIEEIGATAIRLAHYPHAQYFYSLADRNGMILWAELPIVNRVGGPGFAANARQQLIELIRQSYNHPAIVFWSMANEVRAEGWGPDPAPLLSELHALAKQEDPDRLTTLASCCEIANDSTLTITDTVAFNRYFGWYHGSYQDFGPWADATHRAMPGRAIAVAEYGAGASIFLHALNPGLSLVHTEEYQATFHEAYWRAMKTRPFLWGKFVWNMFDFASDSRTEGDTNGRNDKGLVTFDRGTRKDAFYWYKANWTTAPMVYITSRRWTERTVATTDIKIYSNTDAVELIVNGVSLGVRAPISGSDRSFIWANVTLSAGANAVQAIGRTAAATVTDTVTWNLPSAPVGGWAAAINFQLASALPYPGFLVDSGATFGDRGNGLSYGWSQDASGRARDRNSILSPDQRYDTLIHMDAMTWEIAVPNGTYSVRAVVGDPNHPDLNSKLTIEGVLAIDGMTSIIRPWLPGTVTVTVSDGRLTLGNQAGSYNKICFVEIVLLSPLPPAPPPPPPPPVAGIRFDLGSGVSFTDSAGNVWQADQFSLGGIVSSKTGAIANTVDDDLYRTYRYGNFSYAIPVANGTYDVSLGMMETWWDASGRRVFNVSAEGTTLLANLDLYAIAGKFTAIERTFSVTVTDGVLNLSFAATIDNAVVSAIAIIRKP